MKRMTRRGLKNASLVVVGIVLARGAQATITLVGDTTITFDNATFVTNNAQVPFNFGSNATTNAPTGIVIGGTGQGLGTPDVSLNWTSKAGVGRSGTPTLFQYVNEGPWNSAQLYNSTPGNTHELIFSVPSFAAVTIESFNFFPYYNNETFSYTVSVKDATTSTVLSTQNVNVPEGAKDAVVVNFQGGLGQSLALDFTRNAFDGTTNNGANFDMAVDDVHFSESTPEPGTTALICFGLGGMGLWARRRKSSSPSP